MTPAGITIDARDSHPLKRYDGTARIPADRVAEAMPLPPKTEEPSVARFAGIVTAVRRVQLEKAPEHSLSSLPSPRSSEARREQSENALLPMTRTASGIATAVRLVQDAKAYEPIFFTVDGIVIEARDLQPLKRLLGISSMPSGRVAAVMPDSLNGELLVVTLAGSETAARRVQ